MNIDELIRLKEEIVSKYKKEERKLNFSRSLLVKKNITDELHEISRELKKVDKLIEIYKSNDSSYIVMMLERLYMNLQSGFDDKFDEFSDEKLFNIFDRCFPSDWVLNKYSDSDKEKMLLHAICENRLVDATMNEE